MLRNPLSSVRVVRSVARIVMSKNLHRGIRTVPAATWRVVPLLNGVPTGKHTSDDAAHGDDVVSVRRNKLRRGLLDQERLDFKAMARQRNARRYDLSVRSCLKDEIEDMSYFLRMSIEDGEGGRDDGDDVQLQV